MKRNQTIGLALALGLGLSLGVPMAALSQPNAAAAPRAVIVQFTPGTDVAAQARALRESGGRVSFEYRNVFPGLAAELPERALSALAKNPNVELIEADAVATTTGEQSPAPWSLDRIDQPTLPLNGSFAFPTVSRAVTAYVLDTGVLAAHVEFTGRLAPGYSSIADGRGTGDCNGHGTHVAGSIAGSTYGVAKTATIVPVRVLGCDGSGTYSGIIAGLDWVAAHHAAGAPAVANLSLGGPTSSTLNTAVQRVIDDGVSVVVAAGNSNVDACTSSPASAPNALTVAASDRSDLRAGFSNFGSCVDLFAPGVGVTSAWYTSSSATATLDGTSMASPHVAGAVALLLAQRPDLLPAAAGSTLLGQTVSGLVQNAGTGTPNRLLQVAELATPTTSAPSAATSVAATAGKRSATVSWLPGANGGSALTGQTVHIYVGATQVGTLAVGASATKATVSGLTAGVSYTFRLSATNAVGVSPLSAASNPVTPRR